MTRLGSRQLELLRSVGTTSAVISGAALADTRARCRKLVALGLMHEPAPGLATITPDGLRALADAVDAGRISLFERKKDQN
ncbi:hypothetical protein [Roseibium sediminicola]|uniref:Transcriptional regulator n=1 Tax=Roseibium sediminicola TaxID=2933272 RepID=A0ABT0H291_9HYPH|nr:hypothetical protein [Roseibium sp. CAU 1639]MCK7615205.1 hypothetical protein [Roseibium sp. CAU 1639]